MINIDQRLPTIGFWAALFVDAGMVRWCVRDDPFNLARDPSPFAVAMFVIWICITTFLYAFYLIFRSDEYSGMNRVAGTFVWLRIMPLLLWSILLVALGVL